MAVSTKKKATRTRKRTIKKQAKKQEKKQEKKSVLKKDWEASLVKKKSVRKSDFLSGYLSPRSTVISYSSSGYDPEPKEKIITSPNDALLNKILNDGDEARGHRLQRKESKKRVDKWLKKYHDGEVSEISVYLVTDPRYPGLLIPADGLHKVRMALCCGFKGLISISICEGKSPEAVRRYISDFDSKESTRTTGDLATYAFDEYPELTPTDISKVNSPIANIVRCQKEQGCDFENVQVFFHQKSIASREHFAFLRDNYVHVVKWHRENINPLENKYFRLHVGIRTAVILSYLADGDSCMDVWQPFMEMAEESKKPGYEFPPCAGALLALRDYVLDKCINKGGKMGQSDEFNIALWAYLVVSGRMDFERFDKRMVYTLNGPVKKSKMA